MVQYLEKYKKNIAIDFRKKGFSYSEIGSKINIPKSTLAYWLKDVSLTEDQKKNLQNRRSEVARNNSEKRVSKVLKEIEEIKNSSSKDIRDISKRELWLMGIMLYWRERLAGENQSDIRRGINLTSSDPYLVRLFLKWLQEVGQVGNEEIRFDIFANEGKKEKESEMVSYWSEVTGFRDSGFKRVYYQKTISKKSKKKTTKRKRNSEQTSFGILRIRVKSSSMLARQIAGWMKGIINLLLK